MENKNNVCHQKITRTEYQKKQRKLRKRTRLRPWAFFTLCFIFCLVLIINFAIVFEWGKDNKNINDLNQELEEIVQIKEIDEQGEIVNQPTDVESDYWYYIKVPFYDVDFTNLLEKNSDTVGFINVKGTNINYPIVQSSDNEFYLNHDYDKTKNDAGWVYLDYRNNNQFIDFNTIIYGHGRLNKTVFGSLKNLLSKDWQNNKDNYTMSISTPSMNFIYQIFSIYTIDSEGYYIQTEFDSVDDKKEWINTMNSRNTSIIDAAANENDRVITLSTCLNNDGGRIVVHAKLVKQQKKSS